MTTNGGQAAALRPRWVPALAGVALVLYVVGYAVRLHCGWGRCGGSAVARLVDLDALGGLPRLFTTGLFVAVAVLAWRARRRLQAGPAAWWGLVALAGVALALAKLVSVHGFAKTGMSPALTLAAGLGLTVAGLVVLRVTGRRWAVPGAGAVVLAMAVYAAAALGLDVVTGAVGAIRGSWGPLTDATATFVEELGEALAALFLLAVVRRQSSRV
ncbi:hypothetical protein ACI797_01335 [Geodermatophilus sp. SYSU D00691]